MDIAIENEECEDTNLQLAKNFTELEEKYNLLKKDYNEIETDLINLEKKNYFEKINN
jgi:hypothetical protein